MTPARSRTMAGKKVGLRRFTRRTSLRLRAILLATGCLLGFPGADARGQSPPTPLSAEDMARNAKVIGLATVQSVEARKDESTGLVYTDFTLVFSEVWKGTPREPFILAKAGGTFGGQRSTIAGREYRLGVGQALVVFASESLGNRYAAIGLRQGLYRIGNGDDPMLFRVSEYPERMGESSPLRLSALREQVFRVIPRPGTPGKTAPPPSADAPAQERSPIVPSRPSLPAPSPAEPGCGRAAGASSRVWAVLGLGIVAAVAIFLNLRRK